MQKQPLPTKNSNISEEEDESNTGKSVEELEESLIPKNTYNIKDEILPDSIVEEKLKDLEPPKWVQ